ncbi:transposase [Streptomyces sp. NPDC058442]|uniref:transposase n=1 Tax=Streptomyces sp. NPDC058442 TaxID=3346503 RepID=UPI003663BA37
MSPAPDKARHLKEWITRVRADGLPRLEAFTRGPERDRGAVLNAFTLPFHNGGTEGVDTKTELIRRQMYGRAGFCLLRHRILLNGSIQPTINGYENLVRAERLTDPPPRRRGSWRGGGSVTRGRYAPHDGRRRPTVAGAPRPGRDAAEAGPERQRARPVRGGEDAQGGCRTFAGHPVAAIG